MPVKKRKARRHMNKRVQIAFNLEANKLKDVEQEENKDEVVKEKIHVMETENRYRLPGGERR